MLARDATTVVARFPFVDNAKFSPHGLCARGFLFAQIDV